MKEKKRIEEEEDYFGESLSDADREIYRLMFRELDRVEDINIPSDFALKIATKQIRKERIWRDIKLYAIYSISFIGLVAITMLFFALDPSPMSKSLINSISASMPFLIMGALGYFVIQTLDRILVKKRSLF